VPSILKFFLYHSGVFYIYIFNSIVHERTICSYVWFFNYDLIIIYTIKSLDPAHKTDPKLAVAFISTLSGSCFVGISSCN
jgi:hypothetical protein